MDIVKQLLIHQVIIFAFFVIFGGDLRVPRPPWAPEATRVYLELDPKVLQEWMAWKEKKDCQAYLEKLANQESRVNIDI